jgi:hypothetical protein
LPLEVAHLAHRYELSATIQRLDLDGIPNLLDQLSLAIVFLDRGVIDGVFAVHAVIPIRVSQSSVTFLDPLQGQRRVTRRRFDAAWGTSSSSASFAERADPSPLEGRPLG